MAVARLTGKTYIRKFARRGRARFVRWKDVKSTDSDGNMAIAWFMGKSAIKEARKKILGKFYKMEGCQM